MTQSNPIDQATADSMANMRQALKQFRAKSEEQKQRVLGEPVEMTVEKTAIPPDLRQLLTRVQKELRGLTTGEPLVSLKKPEKSTDQGMSV